MRARLPPTPLRRRPTPQHRTTRHRRRRRRWLRPPVASTPTSRHVVVVVVGKAADFRVIVRYARANTNRSMTICFLTFCCARMSMLSLSTDNRRSSLFVHSLGADNDDDDDDDDSVTMPFVRRRRRTVLFDDLLFVFLCRTMTLKSVRSEAQRDVCFFRAHVFCAVMSPKATPTKRQRKDVVRERISSTKINAWICATFDS
jgi:hypothetical protein